MVNLLHILFVVAVSRSGDPAMSISTSPTLSRLACETDPTAPAVGFTFRAAWPETEPASATIAIAELLAVVRSMVATRFRGAPEDKSGV
jgi:hypothetical protein